MTASQAAQEKRASPRPPLEDALRELIRVSKGAGMNAASDFGYMPSQQQADEEEISEAVQAVYAAKDEREAAAATPSLDVAAFLDSLRTPRNSLGKLALPKGPMEWAVEEAWVPPAVEELDDSGDGVMIHRLSELADLIIDRLQARLARLDEGSKDSGRPNEVATSATPDQGKGEPR